MNRFEDRVALITGAARGIGGATARLLAAEGARVVICDLLPEGAALAQEIGSKATFLPLDVADEDSWRSVVADVEEAIGVIDVLVNNAGIVHQKVLTEMEVSDFERVLRVNLIGSFLGIKHVGGRMMHRKRGAIVNVCSNQGLRASNAMGAYASSKWGLRGLTHVAALELSLHGVRVNSVSPGSIDTPMTNPGGVAADILNQNEGLRTLPLQRFGTSDEIARACVFLASDDASYITGTDLAVDGGMTAGRYLGFAPGGPSSKAP